MQVERIRKVTGLKLSHYRSGFPVPLLACLAVAIPWVLIARYAHVMSRPVPNIVFGLAACLVACGLAGALQIRQTGQPA
jgi:hypothetical protein